MVIFCDSYTLNAPLNFEVVQMKSRTKAIVYSPKKRQFVMRSKCKLKLEFKPIKDFSIERKKLKLRKGVYKCYIRHKKDKILLVLIINPELLNIDC